jgi:uncharacterized membrane protein YdjX (TVP38/TMEM64 family)
MTVSNRDHTRNLVVAIGLLAGLALLGAVLTYLGYLGPALERLWKAFQGRDEMRVYVESCGNWAPAAFVFLQSAQVVLAPIPGEVTGAVGGFIFGAVPSLFYSTAGLTIGSFINFLAARFIGLPIVKLAVSDETLDRFCFLTERRGTVLSLALFAIPGFPKDLLCYILGLSPMGFITFAVVCTLGRTPGTAMLSFGGAAVYCEDWLLVVGLAAIAVVCIALFFTVRDRMEVWLRQRFCKTP